MGGKRPAIAGGTNTIEAEGDHYVFEISRLLAAARDASSTRKRRARLSGPGDSRRRQQQRLALDGVRRGLRLRRRHPESPDLHGHRRGRASRLGVPHALLLRPRRQRREQRKVEGGAQRDLFELDRGGALSRARAHRPDPAGGASHREPRVAQQRAFHGGWHRGQRRADVGRRMGHGKRDRVGYRQLGARRCDGYPALVDGHDHRRRPRVGQSRVTRFAPDRLEPARRPRRSGDTEPARTPVPVATGRTPTASTSLPVARAAPWLRMVRRDRSSCSSRNGRPSCCVVVAEGGQAELRAV
jgi:hypothetical protein